MKNYKILWILALISILMLQIDCTDSGVEYDEGFHEIYTGDSGNIISFSEMTLVPPEEIYFGLTDNSQLYKWGHLADYPYRPLRVILEINTQGKITGIKEDGPQDGSATPIKYLKNNLPRIWHYNKFKHGTVTILFRPEKRISLIKKNLVVCDECQGMKIKDKLPFRYSRK